jgi:hypothetical protein
VQRKVAWEVEVHRSGSICVTVTNGVDVLLPLLVVTIADRDVDRAKLAGNRCRDRGKVELDGVRIEVALSASMSPLRPFAPRRPDRKFAVCRLLGDKVLGARKIRCGTASIARPWRASPGPWPVVPSMSDRPARTEGHRLSPSAHPDRNRHDLAGDPGVDADHTGGYKPMA